MEYPYESLFIEGVNMKFRIGEERETKFSVVNDKAREVWIDKLPNITPHELVTRLMTITSKTITIASTQQRVYVPDFIHKSSEECMHILDMCTPPELAKLWFISWMVLLAGATQENWEQDYRGLAMLLCA